MSSGLDSTLNSSSIFQLQNGQLFVCVCACEYFDSTLHLETLCILARNIVTDEHGLTTCCTSWLLDQQPFDHSRPWEVAIGTEIICKLNSGICPMAAG